MEAHVCHFQIRLIVAALILAPSQKNAIGISIEGRTISAIQLPRLQSPSQFHRDCRRSTRSCRHSCACTANRRPDDKYRFPVNSSVIDLAGQFEIQNSCVDSDAKTVLK